MGFCEAYGLVRLRLRAVRRNWPDSQCIGSKLRHSPFQCSQLRIQLLATPTTRLIASFWPPGGNHSRSKSTIQHDRKRSAGLCKKVKIIAVLPGFARRGPGHFDGLRSTVEGWYEPFNLAAIADQPQTRTRRTRQPRPSQKRCVTHSQLPKSSYGPRPAP